MKPTWTPRVPEVMAQHHQKELTRLFCTICFGSRYEYNFGPGSHEPASSTCGLSSLIMVGRRIHSGATVEPRKLENDRPPTPKARKEGKPA